MDEQDGNHWVGTWTTAPVPVDGKPWLATRCG